MEKTKMEWLMTYGWAILIVVIVAAALYALPADYSEVYPKEYASCKKLAEHLEAGDWGFSVSMMGDAICRMNLEERCIVFEDNINWCPFEGLDRTEYRARIKSD